MNNMNSITKHYLEKFDCEILESKQNHSVIFLNKSNQILNLVQDLKIVHKFKILIDICGVDYPNKSKRFEVVYQFLNIEDNLRITVKLATSEEESVESLTKIFSSACWFERETFDMYGIVFSNTHDLRRILTDYNFKGFPLRKDFPLTGFTELQYDQTLNKIVEQPVNLSQEYRNFDFESPWENVQYEVKKS